MSACEDAGATMAYNMMDLSALEGVQAFIEKRMPNLVAGQQAQAVDQPVTAHRIEGEVDPGRTDDLAHRLPPVGTAHRMVRTAARGEGTLALIGGDRNGREPERTPHLDRGRPDTPAAPCTSSTSPVARARGARARRGW